MMYVFGSNLVHCSNALTYSYLDFAILIAATVAWRQHALPDHEFGIRCGVLAMSTESIFSHDKAR